MKALVTGATGFIGSHLVDDLLAAGYEVRCLVRTSSNLQWLKNKPVELWNGSFFDDASLAGAVKSVEYIFHAAGLTAARSRAEFFRGNYEASARLLEAAAAQRANIRRFVHVSSQAAVGPSPTATPVNESAAYHPITAYGESKRAAEEAVNGFASDLPVTIVRPPAV